MQLADRILTKLGISTTDLLNGSELDDALRTKMSLWDTELGASPSTAGTPDIDWDRLFPIKKPAARSSVSSSLDSKTG